LVGRRLRKTAGTHRKNKNPTQPQNPHKENFSMEKGFCCAKNERLAGALLEEKTVQEGEKGKSNTQNPERRVELGG